MILYDSTLITPTTGLMIWTLVTFVIVLIVLQQVRVRPDPADDRRRAARRSSADLDAAESAREEAQAALAEYRQQLAEARKEAGKIVEDARRRRRRAPRARPSPSSRPRRPGSCARPRRRSPAETRQALNAIKQQVADLAVAATEKVVRARLDEAEQRRLIDEALADVDLSTLVPARRRAADE